MQPITMQNNEIHRARCKAYDRAALDAMYQAIEDRNVAEYVASQRQHIRASLKAAAAFLVFVALPVYAYLLA